MDTSNLIDLTAFIVLLKQQILLSITYQFINYVNGACSNVRKT